MSRRIGQVKKGRYVEGFSLIEIMITLVIVGILGSMAYPSYIEYLTRARRIDGQTALLELANQMEQFYTENQTYLTATLGTGSPTDIRRTTLTPEGWYRLSIAYQTQSEYTLKAVPQRAQARYDTLCQTLSFNQFGEKGPQLPQDKSHLSCWS